MKKSILGFLVAGMVLLTTGVWFLKSLGGLTFSDLWHFGIIILLVGFGIFVAFQKYKNSKRGQPEEDELSKKVIQKSASTSYFISLYIWVFIIFIKDRIQFDTEELLGSGVLAMAITFAVTWLVINFKGLGND